MGNLNIFKAAFFAICLCFVLAPKKASAQFDYKVVSSLSYLSAPLGTYGFGIGGLAEYAVYENFGVESGVIYFERALSISGKKIGFYSFNIPFNIKYHLNSNYFVGLGYSADFPIQNQAMFYNLGLFVGYKTDATLGWLGLPNSRWNFELHYLQDQTQDATFNTILGLIGIRF